ncbi:unnamed protein product [Tetraodon nigroviridis]|uniref:(spotted green pufferfish) hypothetical protein n=1 Tax=Tetraodon nigroviridis TaxID=99883 RepID=Q4RJN9_TETNG|nr:unnamed protein product [Tetraodon nigroviridis]
MRFDLTGKILHFFPKILLTLQLTPPTGLSVVTVGRLQQTPEPKLFHLRLLRHAPEPETEPVLGASVPSCGGDHLFRPLRAVPPLHRLLRGGAAGGDQLRVPPPPADPAHVQHRQGHALPRQQHGQPGHVRGVPHQHAGLDDPLAGAQPGQGATGGLHAGQRGPGHHDPHEHRPVLPAPPERLLEERRPGEQEGEGDVAGDDRGRRKGQRQR